MEEDLYFKDTQDLNFLISHEHSAFQMYKDLLNPTVTWETSRAKESTINPDYIPRQSVFLKDPQVQKQFREEMLERLSEVPTPDPLHLQCDILLSEFLALKLKSKPELVRLTLSKFYYTQVISLQQFKYKFILNWANICQFYPLNLSTIKDKLREFDSEVLECVESYERLRSPEDFPLVPTKHDSTKNDSINILSRDIEYYIKTGSKTLQDSRRLTCLSNKIKWLWVSNRTEIWKRSVCLLAQLKKKSLERMKLLTGHDDFGELKVVSSLVTNVNLKNLKKQQEIQRRAQAEHSVFAEEHKNLNEQLLNSNVDEVDSPPLIITSLKQLNGLLDTICKEFKLVGDVGSDDGHALSYQITHLLPELFEVQRKRQEWKPYEPPDKDLVALRMAYIQSLKRAATLKRVSTEIMPHQIPGYKFLKTLSIKEPDWLKCKQLNPKIENWQKRQTIRLEVFGKCDSLLKSSFELLDVQDLPTINRVIEEFSMNYCERASKRGVLKTDLGLSDEDIKKRYFSNLLADSTSSVYPAGEDAIELPLITIKGLYTLKLLKSRGLKQKLYEIFNYFRSVERKLRLDLSDTYSLIENISKQSTQSKNPLLESLDGEITQYLPDKMPHIYGRQDQIEYLEGSVYVIDETGEYIIYSQVENDVKSVINELMLLGSFYIDKYEVWSEDQGENFPVIDRDFLTNELLEEEVKFQEVKSKIINDYLDIYRHSVSHGQQLQVAQKISDLIAMRPRLLLKGSYFTQSYWAHIQALEQHSLFIRSALSEYNVFDMHEVMPYLYPISEVWDKVKNCIDEISLIHETEDTIALSTLEQSVWESAFEAWRASSSYTSPFSDNIILDNPSQAIHLYNSIKEELPGKNLLPKMIPSMFETKFRGTLLKDIPSDLQILCNILEAFRFRSSLEVHYEENAVLEAIYRKQCLNMKRENVELEFINFFGGNPHMSNLRDWPGTRNNFKLPAFEITPVLTEHLDLKSAGCFKEMILPTGLEELRAVTEYQVTHKHLLIIATQLNQYICDRAERQIAEIEIARSVNYVPKKSRVHWPNVLGRKGEGLVEEKAENEIKSIKARIFSQISEMFTDCRKFKVAHREEMKENYNRILKKYLAVIGEKSPFQDVVSRNLVALSVNGYCRSILNDIYTHSIRLHLIKVSCELKLLLRVVPSDLYTTHFTTSEIFDSEGRLINTKVSPSIESIMSIKPGRISDALKDWDPYFYAETPDIIQKKIKSLAFRPRRVETNASNIIISHEWSFASMLKSTLEVMRAVMHIIQIQIFQGCLSVKKVYVMDLQEMILEGKDYWKAKETQESAEMHLRAVEGLLAEDSPVQHFYNTIKKSLEELDEVNKEVAEVPVEMQVSFVVQYSRNQFQKIAAVIFESQAFALMEKRGKDSKDLLDLLTNCFRYNRRSLFVRKSEKYLMDDCEFISLCDDKVFIDNSPAEKLGSALLKDLESAFLPVDESVRMFAAEQFKMIEGKLRDHLANKQQKKGIMALELANGYLESVLQSWRLKTTYFMIKSGGDLISCPILYTKVWNHYENTIGLKALVASKNLRDDSYLSKSISEVKILKEVFNILLCKFSINYIHEECGRVFDTSRLTNNISMINEFTCNADRSYNDITKKIGSIHLYLNILRNRSTLVEAPTCGKAHVFLVKDTTALTKKFADNIVKFMESEYRVREESFLVQAEFYTRLKSQKAEEIEELTKTFKDLKGNIDNLVNSQLSQKGNSLIYELDRSHRRLQEIKANMKLMPKQIREFVYLDYKDEIETNNRKISDLKQNFKNFKAQLTQELKADISFHKTSVFTEIKGKTSKSKAKQINNMLNDDITYTKKKERIDLNYLQNKITLIMFMKIWARTYRKNKFQRNISSLEDQLVSNQSLWEQLNESQRREALLKQELSYTQQSLAAAEKLADKLQTSIEDMNNQRLRLQQYKSNKGKRLNELEARVKQHEKVEHKDNQILLNEFYVQNERIQSLQVAEEKAGLEYIPHHIRYQREIMNLKKTLEREQSMKLSAFDELNKFRGEMKNLNKDPEARVKDLRNEYQKVSVELKVIKDQNNLFKKRMNDVGDNEFLNQFQRSRANDLLSAVSSKNSKRFDD